MRTDGTVRVRHAGTWSVCCSTGGCVFLRSGLSRRQAELAATEHIAVFEHAVTMVDMGQTGMARPLRVQEDG